MSDVLTFNQSIFGTKTKKQVLSNKAKKAQKDSLFVPTNVEEISYDEGYEIDGGSVIGTIAAAVALYGFTMQGCREAGIYVKQECGVKSFKWYQKAGILAVFGFDVVLYGCFMNGFNSVE